MTLSATGFQQDKQWNWKNFWTVTWLCWLGQWAFGYPASVISVTLAQPSFLKYMKLVDESGVATEKAESYIGATSGLFQAGAVFGVIINSFIMDAYGRKAGTWFCVACSIIGGAGCVGAVHIGMFIAFRLIAGMGSWAFLALTSTYSAELAPPALRGFFTGQNGIGISIGYALAAYVGLGFHGVGETAAQWRGPLGIALFFPIVMGAYVHFFVPESPRFLLLKGRAEEAREIVLDIHRVDSDPDQEYARSEFYQMQKQAEFDRAMVPTYWAMFTKKSYRKRTLIACYYAFLGQSLGNLVINNYGPTLYGALGFDTLAEIKLHVGWTTIGIPANAFAACVVDRVGRKPLIIYGILGACSCLIVEAAIIANFATPVPAVNPNSAALRAGVAMLYLFLVAYSIGVDSTAFVYFGEIFPNHLRAKGVALAIATLGLTDLVYTEVAPTAFANVGWKFFLYFIIASALGAALAAWILPETKGIPLEEMAAVFGDKDEVIVFSENIHVDHNTHDLLVDVHTERAKSADGAVTGTDKANEEGSEVYRVATEAGHQGHHVEHVGVREKKGSMDV
ncbi:hypothetical protein AYL99_11438 [Fonsecaea erecta]|uniref:Major facilitator superfamily (MFS) profile domain-containing protein n=1 Tax=Fonsecaea erecta TaxID=1367422 RepID=A0A178Z3K3_9EURO|nr:hypothetical protein AYL99_11438 [Fonsecaea erecta]OAP54337.1 hypothetical protein AYL99_11438 [Fonsecaea erecta]